MRTFRHDEAGKLTAEGVDSLKRRRIRVQADEPGPEDHYLYEVAFE